MGVSNLTNSLLLTPPYSAIHEHSKVFIKIFHNSFKIIANGNSDIELLIKESFSIKDYRPLLNNINSSFQLSKFNLFIFLFFLYKACFVMLNVNVCTFVHINIFFLVYLIVCIYNMCLMLMYSCRS